MKILFSTSSLFPYRVDWLDEMSKFADIDIYYLQDDDPDRVTEWCAKRPLNCSYTLMKSKKMPFLGLKSREFINVLKTKGEQYDFIILDGYGYYTQYLNIKYLNKHKFDYFVNIDGMVPKKNNLFARIIKKRIISKIPHFLCGSFATNKLLINFGSKQERILNHPFTSLKSSDILKSPLDNLSKDNLKKKIGISEKMSVISVGRFSYLNGYGKGYDVLIKAAKRLEKENIGWYIVGGMPTEEFKKMVSDAKLANVHFVDFLNKEQLTEYYKASDVFVLMTISDVWGLVVNEAMANGLPVITTNKCVAGLDLVEDWKNGFLLDVGDDVGLSEKIKFLMDSNLRLKMSQESLNRIASYTIENMGKIHKKYFEDLYAKQLHN